MCACREPLDNVGKYRCPDGCGEAGRIAGGQEQRRFASGNRGPDILIPKPELGGGLLDRWFDQVDPVARCEDEAEEFAAREVVLPQPAEPTRRQISANGAFVVVVQTGTPERGRIEYRPGQQVRPVLRRPVGQHFVDIQRAFPLPASASKTTR